MFPRYGRISRLSGSALLPLAWVILVEVTSGRSLAGVQSTLSPSGFQPEACEAKAESLPALAAVLKGAKSHPTADALAALGLQCAQKEQCGCAIAAFRAALRLDPALWKDHYNLGLAFAHTGDQKQAASELRVAIQQKEDDFLAHHALGLALQTPGDLDVAVKQFQIALRLEPDSAAAFDLAQVFEAQGKDSAAIHYVRRALASNPPPTARVSAAFEARRPPGSHGPRGRSSSGTP